MKKLRINKKMSLPCYDYLGISQALYYVLYRISMVLTYTTLAHSTPSGFS